MVVTGHDWADTLLACGIVAAALRLAWVDARRLEIELETLWIMAGLAVLQVLRTGDGFDLFIRTFSAIAFWACLVLGNRHLRGLARFGAGDPPLVGVIAFLVAPFLVFWAILAAILALGTCAWYSIRRGKRLFRSMYPAAPPLLAAGMAIYLAHRM
ncbi:hypothetical protein LAZ40_03390 [Cereibacter sphaeroides]|uniref:hypothetical protein n=1 Tax=Cereibacter sphaeroides TaxID=1063 RepID=UPI001F278244|nr:hypothetical protein [Cereibacter sphaeroides]MCE6958100.1 hypothetical protein [Cereibacter sphaeroides]